MIRFDTLDKKPKLWNLLILTCVAAAIVAVLALLYREKSIIPISVLLAVYYLTVPVLLIRAFIRQLRYNPYSYNTIFYFGFALFALSAAIVHIVLMVRIIKNPEYRTPDSFIYPLLSSAKNYIIISAPFFIMLSVALIGANITLLRREGRRLVNFLGIAFSIFLLCGLAFIYFFDMEVTGSQTEVMIHDLITNLAAALSLYFECMLIGVMVGDAIVSKYEPEGNVDFLIILGCGLRKDGTPTPLLRSRIDRAIAFSEKQKKETGKELTFITSGGKGTDEVNSESASMKRYLMEHGIPEERIIEEDRSVDTFENMRNSKEIIDRIAPGAVTAFSTSNFHVFRSGIFARRVKMRAVGIGAKTKWYFWPNAALREFLGLLTKHKVKQILILGGIMAFYVVLTLIAYR